MSHTLGQSTAAPSIAFGGRIRDLRRKSEMTLQTLADEAGISIGFLSQVERDKATPSLGTLAAIADALGVEIDVFIAQPKMSDSLSRAGERPMFGLSDHAVHYEKLTTTLPGGTLTTLIMHIPAGFTSELVAHVGEEVIYILEGHLRQTLGEACVDLKPGDSLHFMGDTPHAYANPGPGPCRILWTGNTPRLIGRGTQTQQLEVVG